MVGSFAFLFGCLLVGRESSSVMGPALELIIYEWYGWGLMLRLLSGPSGFNCWIYFAPVTVDPLSLFCLLFIS